MLVPGNAMRADPGTLQHSSGLKFRLGPDCSRLEKRLEDYCCKVHSGWAPDTLCLSDLAEKTNALIVMTPNLHVLLILMFFRLMAMTDALVQTWQTHESRVELPECNVTATSQTPLSWPSNTNASFLVSTQLFIKY